MISIEETLFYWVLLVPALTKWKQYFPALFYIFSEFFKNLELSIKILEINFFSNFPSSFPRIFPDFGRSKKLFFPTRQMCTGFRYFFSELLLYFYDYCIYCTITILVTMIIKIIKPNDKEKTRLLFTKVVKRMSLKH